MANVFKKAKTILKLEKEIVRLKLKKSKTEFDHLVMSQSPICTNKEAGLYAQHRAIRIEVAARKLAQMQIITS